MNKISRKGFLKIAAAAAMSGVTAGALAACNSASSSTAASSAAAPAGTYIPGTYEGTAEGISSTVKVTMTFSDSAVTDVVVDTSGETASYGAAAADQLREQLMAAGSAEIDGVSGSTITSDAVMKAAKSCYAQAGDVGTGCTGSSRCGGGRAGSIAGSQSTGSHTRHGSSCSDLQKTFTGDLVHFAWFLSSCLFLLLYSFS